MSIWSSYWVSLAWCCRFHSSAQVRARGCQQLPRSTAGQPPAEEGRGGASAAASTGANPTVRARTVVEAGPVAVVHVKAVQDAHGRPCCGRERLQPRATRGFRGILYCRNLGALRARMRLKGPSL